MRKIIHLDTSSRGVVTAASYEARKFGIHSARASRLAKQKCYELIFVPPRFEIYRGISKQIHQIFEQYHLPNASHFCFG